MRMTSSQLKISVVVPLYNKSNYIVEALESVFSQTFPAHEVIVVDDGSTDDGVASVKSIGHPAVRVIQQPNAGVSAARNTGVDAAMGDVIAFLDADDRYLPNFLAAIAQLAQDFPNASAFGTAFRRFSNGSPSRLATSSSRARLRRGIIDNFYAEWCRSSFICSSSVAVRVTALRELDIYFPEGERLGEDQDVWFRLAECYAVAFDPTILCEYRIDVAGSATQSARADGLLPCYQRLATRLSQGAVPSRLVPGARRLVASHYLNVARSRLNAGDAKGATQLVLHPMARANPVYLLRTGLLVCMARLGLKGTK